VRSIFLPGTIEICRTRFLVTQWMKPEVNPCLTTGSCSTEEKGAWATVLKVSGLKTKNKQELDRIAIVYISRLEGRRRGRGRNHADGTGRPRARSPQWTARLRQWCISWRKGESTNCKARREARRSRTCRSSQNGHSKRERVEEDSSQRVYKIPFRQPVLFHIVSSSP